MALQGRPVGTRGYNLACVRRPILLAYLGSFVDVLRVRSLIVDHNNAVVVVVLHNLIGVLRAVLCNVTTVEVAQGG